MNEFLLGLFGGGFIKGLLTIIFWLVVIAWFFGR